MELNAQSSDTVDARKPLKDDFGKSSQFVSIAE